MFTQFGGSSHCLNFFFMFGNTAPVISISVTLHWVVG